MQQGNRFHNIFYDSFTITDSEDLTSKMMKNTKKDFKEAYGTTLKVKEQSSMTDFEVIGIQSYISSARTVYCKRITVFEITN